VAQGRNRDAEVLLGQSMASARKVGALSWRLRAATDLAGLWCTGSRTDDARRMLSPIVDEFTEGFSTHDLRAAARLLAECRCPAITCPP
jgi:predicted ATPase